MTFDNITELKRRIPGGKYALTRAVAERARQLQDGALPLTEVHTPNPISVAINEILEGKINFDIKAQSEAGEVAGANSEKDTKGTAEK